MKPYPVQFRPIPVERLWGGHTMKKHFSVEHLSHPIGEYWLLSAHPNALSVVENGPLAGKTLQELTEKYPEAYLGHSPQPRFPILIKLIEARQDLSVQVHPDDNYALQYEKDYGKSEAWYILNSPTSQQMIYGHRFQNREEYIQAVKSKRVREYLIYQSICEGDLVYVPAGTLHALLADTVLLEVQQTSDVTYRVYDWDRTDTSGKPRQLHVDKAADVLSYHTQLPHQALKPYRQERNHVEVLIDCPFFHIDRVQLKANTVHTIAPIQSPITIIMVSGTAFMEWDTLPAHAVKHFAAWMIPVGSKARLTAQDDVVFLQVTYHD